MSLGACELVLVHSGSPSWQAIRTLLVATHSRQAFGRVCRAIVDLARLSDDFNVRCNAPDDGSGVHPSTMDVGPREVAITWDQACPVDIFHEVHAQDLPTRPRESGIFEIYPDGAELGSDCPRGLLTRAGDF